MSAKIPEKTLYAFYEYDLPPYFLGGELIEVLDSGRVLIKGYGDGKTPMKIFPYDVGVTINDELKKKSSILLRKHKQEKTILKLESEKLLGINHD